MNAVHGIGVPGPGVHGYAVQAGMSYRPRDEGVYLWLRLAFSFLLLDEKEPKNQGRLHRTFPRPSKGLTLRSRSTFCEGKRQAPLREGQALSRPLRALPRPAAGPPHPTQSRLGVPGPGVLGYAMQAGMSSLRWDEGSVGSMPAVRPSQVSFKDKNNKNYFHFPRARIYKMSNFAAPKGKVCLFLW